MAFFVFIWNLYKDIWIFHCVQHSCINSKRLRKMSFRKSVATEKSTDCIWISHFVRNDVPVDSLLRLKWRRKVSFRRSVATEKSTDCIWISPLRVEMTWQCISRYVQHSCIHSKWWKNTSVLASWVNFGHPILKMGTFFYYYVNNNMVAWIKSKRR